MIKKIFSCLFIGSFSLIANPTNPQIASGNVSIFKQNKTLNVSASNKAIINWKDFSIQEGEITRFLQPSASASVLNRVIGNNVSEILGTLESNGHVYLINPSGIIFGKNAVVNTASFTASTLDVLDRDFIKETKMVFKDKLKGKITNFGKIKASIGDVDLLAYQIENFGDIQAKKGIASLICADKIILNPKDGNKFLIQLKKTNKEAEIGILNSGNIEAIKTEIQVDGSPYSLAIKHEGKINAFGVEKKDGRVLIIAKEGTSHITGEITCKNENDTGGEVQLLGKNVAVFEKAKIDASAKNGEGKVLIGGDFQGKNNSILNSEAIFIGPDAEIYADAKEIGNGGKIICWSNESTRFYGTASAKGGEVSGNGGFIEISGKSLDYKPTNSPSTLANNGTTGELLLDPTDIIISAAPTVPGTFSPAPNFSPIVAALSQNLDVVDVTNSLLANNTVISTVADAGGGGGNITLSVPLSWNTNNNLIINSSAVNGSINVNGAITSNAGGGLLLTSGNGTITVAAPITTNGSGNLVFNTINGKIDVNSSVSTGALSTGQITFNSTGTGDINVNNSVLSTGTGDINFTIHDGTISVNHSTGTSPVDVQTNNANININSSGTAAGNCLEVHGGNALNAYGKVWIQFTGDLIINAGGRSILLEPGSANFTYAYLHNIGLGEIRINNCLDLSLKTTISDNSNILVAGNQFVYTGTGNLHLDATGGGPSFPVLIKATRLDIDSNQITLDGGDNPGGLNVAYLESTIGHIDLRTTGSVVLNGGTASTTNHAYILSAGMIQSSPTIGSLYLMANDSNCYLRSSGSLLLNVNGDVNLVGGATSGSAYFSGVGSPPFSMTINGGNLSLQAGSGAGTSAYISGYTLSDISATGNVLIRGGPVGANSTAYILGAAAASASLVGNSISIEGGISNVLTNNAYFQTTSGSLLRVETTGGNLNLQGGGHINNEAYIQANTADVNVLSAGNIILTANDSSAEISSGNSMQIGSTSSPVGSILLTGGNNGVGVSNAIIDSNSHLTVYSGNIQLSGGTNSPINGAFFRATSDMNIPIAGNIDISANQGQAAMISSGNLSIGSLSNPIGTLSMSGGSGVASCIARLQSIFGRLDLYATDAKVAAGIGVASNTAEIWSTFGLTLYFQSLARFIGSSVAHVNLWAMDGSITIESQDTLRFIGDVLVRNSNVGPHDMLAIAGNDISLESNAGVDPFFDNTTNGGKITFVVDNLYPTPPEVGSGAFIYQAGDLQTNNGPIEIYTSQREFNTITGTFNGINFVPGTEYVDTATEIWNQWYPINLGGFPYTIYYKGLTFESHKAMENVFSAFAEMYRDLHPFHEYLGRYLSYSMNFANKKTAKKRTLYDAVKEKSISLFSRLLKSKNEELIEENIYDFFLRQRDQERRYPVLEPKKRD